MTTKRARRLMEVVAAGVKVNENLLGGMTAQEVVGIYEADQARLSRGRQKATLARQKAFTPRAVPNVENMTVKWEPESLATDSAAARATAALGLKRANTAADADMVVVSDLQDGRKVAFTPVYKYGKRDGARERERNTMLAD